MKVRCKISHEQPTETGFKVYEAGREYDLDIFEDKYFEPVGAGSVRTGFKPTPTEKANKKEKGGIEENGN